MCDLFPRLYDLAGSKKALWWSLAELWPGGRLEFAFSDAFQWLGDGFGAEIFLGILGGIIFNLAEPDKLVWKATKEGPTL